MSKRLCMGDIHGNYKALMQCLERSNFNYEEDTLIQLGDVCDGHSQTYEVVEELLKIKNLISIKGNHDDWFNQWIKTGVNPSGWAQGQKATGLSYLDHSRPALPWMIADFEFSGFKEAIMITDVPGPHIKFFNDQLPYYRDEQNNLFIHGGFNRHYYLKEQLPETFWWDRDLWNAALSFGHMSEMEGTPKYKFRMIENFKEVFIGHTTTECWKKTTPMHAANIWNLDTGAGMFGVLTIMCVETKEYWQSDPSRLLYPEYKGRN
jgi:serine/threonine protein phosphatase 1